MCDAITLFFHFIFLKLWHKRMARTKKRKQTGKPSDNELKSMQFWIIDAFCIAEKPFSVS